MKKVLSSIAILAAMGLTGCSTLMGGTTTLVDDCDKNTDGVMSQFEYQACTTDAWDVAAADFKMMDIDGNGKVDADELVKLEGMKEMAAAKLVECDRNSDGQVSEFEYQGCTTDAWDVAAADFKKMDTAGTGKLTSEQLITLFK